MVQKSVLGKGLASLLPPSSILNPEMIIQEHEPISLPAQKDVSNKDRHPGISFVNIQDIRVNSYQPRRSFSDKTIEELAQSIEANGIIQPLIVRKGKDSGYELIAGERRLRAAQSLKMKQVPVVLRKSTDKEALELALIENIQREDLNCIDEALAYFQLVEDFGLTQEEVAQRVGKERATVANALRLLRLPEEIIEDLRKGYLSVGHGKVLLSLDGIELRMRLRDQILEKKWSVREAEAWIQSHHDASKQSSVAKKKLTPQGPIKQRIFQLSQELTRYWSAQVEVQGNEKKGKIVIYYHTQGELDRLIEDMHTKRPSTN